MRRLRETAAWFRSIRWSTKCSSPCQKGSPTWTREASSTRIADEEKQSRYLVRGWPLRSSVQEKARRCKGKGSCQQNAPKLRQPRHSGWGESSIWCKPDVPAERTARTCFVFGCSSWDQAYRLREWPAYARASTAFRPRQWARNNTPPRQRPADLPEESMTPPA